MDSKPSYLVFGGKTGWVGQKLINLLQSQNITVVAADSRLENAQDVAAELDRIKPTNVLNAAGLTGRPNVDWCESHKMETTRVNVIGTLCLIDLCHQRNIHITNFATGCIYHYDALDHLEGNGIGFTEADPPNFDGSFYSKTKAVVEDMILATGYTNVLQLRLRMPISDDLHHRSLVTKITKYEKVVNIPNSMTVLHDMLPVAIAMGQANVVGVHNFTNPGAISHNEILTMYRDVVKKDFTWKNFTLEEHDKVVVAKRSNNELDSSKLKGVCDKLNIELVEIHDAVRGVFERMALADDTDGKK
jgi:3,5-epimerase/4-reductase|tara:strand:+ start:210 stop:1118 length:909 start_codon:yes stop_codon:yes gene_type:complete